MSPPPRIRVTIGRLVVDGADGARGDVLGAAIAEELTRLMAGDAAVVEPPRELCADLARTPDAAGREIAAALHARLQAEIADA